jgi:hypothetical protein
MSAASGPTGKLHGFRLGGKLLRIPLPAVEEFEETNSSGPSEGADR